MWGTRETISDAAADNQGLTLFGKEASFKGSVKCDGAIHVDGRIEGEVRISGELIVGEQGIVKGIISAGTVTISGKINGTITAAHKVQLLKPGVLIGDIHAPAIFIEDGAHFHGMSAMGAHPWVEEGSGSTIPLQEVSSYRMSIHQ